MTSSKKKSHRQEPAQHARFNAMKNREQKFKKKRKKNQETHGSHRSPEKTVQIN